jgi:hypothetical protein
MKNFLYRGQQFRLNDPTVIGRYDTRMLVRDAYRWCFERHPESKSILDRLAAAKDVVWTVAYSYGDSDSHGHGEHDRYAGGHTVVAEWCGIELKFVQSGDSAPLFRAEQIELLNADKFPDVPGHNVFTYVPR